MNENSNTSNTTRKQLRIQLQADAKNRRPPKRKTTQAMQAGARRYPEPPFPKQRHRKPGNEEAIEPAPLYDAPYWQGSEKLAGKVALITGGDSGIGRAVAVLFAREGADVAIVYLSDVSRRSFCRKAVEKTISSLGGLDVWLLRETTPASASERGREARARALVNAFQSGVHCEFELVRRMSSRESSQFID